MPSQEDIIAAIAQLDEDAGGLDKKPHVKAIESLLGEDISADDRDQAWAALKDAQPDAENTEAVTEKKPAAKAEAKVALNTGDEDAPIITNNMKPSFALFGVSIKSGESAPVPKFDADKPFIALCIEKELISVE